MHRRVLLTLAIVLSCSPALLAQATQPADDVDPQYKEFRALMRQLAQLQSQSQRAYGQIEAGRLRENAEYQRRWDLQEQEQRRQYEDWQQRVRVIVIAGGSLAVLAMIWAVLAMRKTYRKQEAAVVAVEATRAQNERVIATLESIARKLDEMKSLLTDKSNH